MPQYHGSELPQFSHDKKKYMKDSIDFIGINDYSTMYAKDCINSSCSLSSHRAIRGYVDSTPERDGVPIGEPMGMPRFFIVPDGLGKVIDCVKKRYHNKPMFVTENGYSSPLQLEVKVEGILQDNKRIEFDKADLSSLAQAIRGGANVRGYFIWTLMDDFEWIHGYGPKFGLYYNRQTLNQIPKLSATWYQSFLCNSSLDNYKADM